MDDQNLHKKKKWIESLILYEIFLITSCVGLLLLNAFLIQRAIMFFVIGSLLLAVLILLVLNLARYRKVLDSIPGEQGKSILASLKQNLWDRA